MAYRYEDLMEAIERSSFAMMTEIFNDPRVRHKELVNCVDKHNQTPLFKAALQNNEMTAKLMVEILLKHRTNPCHIDLNSQYVISYLARDGKDKILELLLSHGQYDLNYKDCFEQTPLFWATSNNHLVCADILIKAGSNVNHLDKNGQTPIFYAAKGGFKEMCKLLVNRGADFQIIDKNRQTPNHYAKKNKHREIQEYFSSLKANQKATKKEQSRMESSHQQEKSARKKKQLAKSQYCIVYTDSKGTVRQLTLEQIQKFAQASKEQFNIVDFLKNPHKLDGDPTPQEKKFEKIGTKILNSMSKLEKCAIFLDPVDPVALNIPTYTTIIKQPMDFGTIRTKLNFNCYASQKQFAHDMNLVFSNCITFNGRDSYYGNVAKQLQMEFAHLYEREFGFNPCQY